MLVLAGCGLYQDVYWQHWGQYERGLLIPMGAGAAALEGRNGMVYTAWGRERISRTELPEVGLFHALILAPPAPIKGSGASYRRRWFVAEDTLHWSLGDWRTPPVPEQTRELVLTFDGKVRALGVGAQRYDASRANVFVIRLDKAWIPSVQRLDTALTKRADPEAALVVIKARLPGDALVKELRLR